MARRTASALNAFLHGVCSDDFDPGDQDALQDVLLDYFTDTAPGDNDSDSEFDLSDDDTCDGHTIMRYSKQYPINVSDLQLVHPHPCCLLSITASTVKNQQPNRYVVHQAWMTIIHLNKMMVCPKYIKKLYDILIIIETYSISIFKQYPHKCM